MIKALTYYIGYLLFSWFSLLEALVNIVVYATGLHLIKGGILNESIFVADYGFKFWCWYSNKFLKRFYMATERLRSEQKIQEILSGED